MAPFFLVELEKAVLQLLLAHGLIADELFLSNLQALRSELTCRHGDENNSKNVVFRNINVAIRPYSMEIKTVIDNSTSPPSLYHGVVNLEDDRISNLHGMHLETSEIHFFGELCRKLIFGVMSSHDISSTLRPATWPISQTASVLEKLSANGWIRQNDAGYWTIGLRAHVELRSFIETVINNIDANDEET